MRRTGYSLVEVLVASAIALVLFTVLIRMSTQASRMFVNGEESLHGKQAAEIFLEALGRDLSQVIQVPGDPRPPVVLTPGGSMHFYVTECPDTLALPVGGRPVTWSRQSKYKKTGRIYPVRNGKVFSHLVLGGWRWDLIAPDPEEDQPDWEVEVSVRLETSALRPSPASIVRRFRLAQPSANFRYFHTHGRVMPGLVKLPAVRDGPEAFKSLGPPGIFPVPPAEKSP